MLMVCLKTKTEKIKNKERKRMCTGVRAVVNVLRSACSGSAWADMISVVVISASRHAGFTRSDLGVFDIFVSNVWGKFNIVVSSIGSHRANLDMRGWLFGGR